MEHDENQVRARLTKLSYYSTKKEDEKKDVNKKKSCKVLPQTTPSVVKAGEIVQVFILNLNFNSKF